MLLIPDLVDYVGPVHSTLSQCCLFPAFRCCFTYTHCCCLDPFTTDPPTCHGLIVVIYLPSHTFTVCTLPARTVTVYTIDYLPFVAIYDDLLLRLRFHRCTFMPILLPSPTLHTLLTFYTPRYHSPNELPLRCSTIYTISIDPAYRLPFVDYTTGYGLPILIYVGTYVAVTIFTISRSIGPVRSAFT